MAALINKSVCLITEKDLNIIKEYDHEEQFITDYVPRLKSLSKIVFSYFDSSNDSVKTNTSKVSKNLVEIAKTSFNLISKVTAHKAREGELVDYSYLFGESPINLGIYSQIMESQDLENKIKANELLYGILRRSINVIYVVNNF